jgi:hypothetical protein
MRPPALVPPVLTEKDVEAMRVPYGLSGLFAVATLGAIAHFAQPAREIPAQPMPVQAAAASVPQVLAPIEARAGGEASEWDRCMTGAVLKLETRFAAASPAMDNAVANAARDCAESVGLPGVVDPRIDTAATGRARYLRAMNAG